MLNFVPKNTLEQHLCSKVHGTLLQVLLSISRLPLKGFLEASFGGFLLRVFWRVLFRVPSRVLFRVPSRVSAAVLGLGCMVSEIPKPNTLINAYLNLPNLLFCRVPIISILGIIIKKSRVWQVKVILSQSLSMPLRNPQGSLHRPRNKHLQNPVNKKTHIKHYNPNPWSSVWF